MKAILALLLGLISISWADDDSVVLEFESPDSAEQSTEIGGDEAVSYGGIIIQVRQGTGINAAPTIALGSDIDDYDNVYCLNFIGLFEASDYDTTTTTSASYTEIDGTRIDLANANCTTHQEADTVFSIVCNNVNGATLTLTFTFVQDDEDDYGLEYIISLADYELSDDTAKLVMVQSLNECGDLIDLDEESEDELEDDESMEDTPEPTEIDSAESTETTEEPETTQVRRRLLQDMSTTDSMEETESTEVDETESGEEESDESTDESTDAESLEEEDGISEDDSGEFDAGFARFVVNGQALDQCDSGSTQIDSTLIYQPDDDELHIVFDPFNCTLVLDPFYGLDGSKYETRYGDNGNTENKPSTTDNAQSFSIIIASFIGLFAYLW